jgi:hypothetical protein
MVVTDDQGRYVLPELLKANYTVWVRGYVLVDSPKLQSAPGKILNLNAVPASKSSCLAGQAPSCCMRERERERERERGGWPRPSAR